MSVSCLNFFDIRIKLNNYYKYFLKAWNCAYGYDIDCQNNVNNPFLMRLKGIFDNDKAYHPFILMLSK
jgi:hypothetical protein